MCVWYVRSAAGAAVAVAAGAEVSNVVISDNLEGTLTTEELAEEMVEFGSGISPSSNVALDFLLRSKLSCAIPFLASKIPLPPATVAAIMAAANAPDLGCTGAECLRGVLDFFLLLVGIGSSKELVEDDARNVPLLVISEDDRTGSTEER